MPYRFYTSKSEFVATAAPEAQSAAINENTPATTSKKSGLQSVPLRGEEVTLQSDFFQSRTRKERENGYSNMGMERSRLAGRYLQVPTFGAGAPPCFLALLWV
ncbi:uncharacterized protein LOC116845236 [Odontomachus brunneus]|uniref:uncharacterized protein LOC116845236 n=1 Tax=Odontomachus brunneus TaxID=486640 RepID=UPI0013F27D9C|nr:uncharacterized protein LOC116845236 [Odontomachus brunneus]